ncbi:MAG: response regulator [Dehalococcoidales bacterium]|nr:response regulator [Dehalococcoidales bacterium]
MKARVANREGITLKVLVIADNRQVIRDITFCLQVRYPEVTVVSVGEGLRGVEMIETESPDLVVVDSSPPDIDTLDLVSKIREFSEVLLFILFEAATDVDRAEWLEAGADDCIARPFSPIELVSKIKAVIRRAQGVDFKPEHVVSFNDRLTGGRMDLKDTKVR